MQNTVNLYQTTWHYIPEDILSIYCHKNFRGKGKVPVHTMKAYGGLEIQLHSFLTLELSRGECYIHAAAVLCARGGDPSTHRLGGWVGPRAGLEIDP